jgi:hypothetical protein
MNIPQQQLLIDENESTKIVPRTNPVYNSTTNKSIERYLDDLFPEQKREDKTIKRTKEILGSLGNKMTEDQMQDVASEVQFLITTWLDEFERQIFNGQTLKELLHERGSR